MITIKISSLILLYNDSASWPTHASITGWLVGGTTTTRSTLFNKSKSTSDISNKTFCESNFRMGQRSKKKGSVGYAKTDTTLRTHRMFLSKKLI